jgi:hypothetical protein
MAFVDLCLTICCALFSTTELEFEMTLKAVCDAFEETLLQHCWVCFFFFFFFFPLLPALFFFWINWLVIRSDLN